MTSPSIHRDVRAYYAEKLATFGPSARGVDWRDAESQRARFEQLLRLCDGDADFSLLDYGCGVGALLTYARERGLGCRYLGFDICPEMLDSGRKLLEGGRDWRLVDDPQSLEKCDYCVASGIFNVRLGYDDETWERYVATTLGELDRLSTKGFAFNMLTIHSDRDRQAAKLFYADPARFFDHCVRRYSRHVALLHDYRLYEFTILVRKIER